MRWQQVAGERAGAVGVQTLRPQRSSEDVLTGLTWGFKAGGTDRRPPRAGRAQL